MSYEWDPAKVTREHSKSSEDDDTLEEYDFSQTKRGPVASPGAYKERITIRIDADEDMNSRGGDSYQALMNQALREYIVGRNKDWEALLR